MSSRNSDNPCKVYVGDLTREASEKDLEVAFDTYGRLKSVWVARNPPGFAFIEFEDERDALDAVKGMDGQEICGRRIRVEAASGRSKSKQWRGGGGGDRGGFRGPPRYNDGGYGGGGGGRGGHRRTFNSDDKCYECGERGHYAYDCRNRGGGGGGGGSSYNRRDRDRSRSRERRRSYSRSRSRSASPRGGR